MANTFLQAQGINVGKSLAEPDFHKTALEIIAAAKAKGCEILLPVDGARGEGVQGRCGQSGPRCPRHTRRRHDPRRRAEVGRTPDRRARLAAAPCSGTARSAPSRSSRSATGTFALAREAARLTKAGKLVSVAGGGDTVAALERGWRDGSIHLRLDRGWRLPRMARRPGIAGRRGARAMTTAWPKAVDLRPRRHARRQCA